MEAYRTSRSPPLGGMSRNTHTRSPTFVFSPEHYTGRRQVNTNWACAQDEVGLLHTRGDKRGLRNYLKNMTNCRGTQVVSAQLRQDILRQERK